MSTPYRQLCISISRQSSCPRQQGIVSWVALCWLLIMLLLGQGLLYYVGQGARQAGDFSRETELRLRAESAVEENYLALQRRSAELDALQPGAKIYLGTTGSNEEAVTGYALKDKGLIYIIATAFDRRTEFGKAAEVHVMAKGVLKKEGDKYVWLGWAP